MPKPFVPPGTKTHYSPDRPIGVQHLRLEFDPDLTAHTLAGRVTLTMVSRCDALLAVELHAVEMRIEKVAVDGQPKVFEYDGEILRVELERARSHGEGFILAVDYRCTPRRGLYFVGPDPGHPDRPAQCWTQGQDEDSRYYFPCVDSPAEKASSEVLCTAPRDLFVLSNGDLVERADTPDGRVRWHYRLDFPHSPYLVTLVCGRFAEVKDRAPETGVDVFYYVPPGREADARRSFGRTPEMIDFFSRRIGIPYPHRRYSQIVVSDFIFGGMENTSAATLTDLMLYDERAAQDFDVEFLVSHELAHQWWGDLLTCREWPEVWLNEGFAMYFKYVWRAYSKGRDEADVDLLSDGDAYLDESSHYQRPILCRQYEAPIDLFDRHLLEKGERVLHMLRHDLGEEVFWRALSLYAERHARGVVETRDFVRAVEEASGRNFDAFFDQWVTNAGHPELFVTWEWDPERKIGVLHVEQKPTDDKLYILTVGVRFEVDGQEQDETVEVREKSHTFEFRLRKKPTQVVFDPGDVVLKRLDFKKPLPLWERQLGHACLGVDRILAARALGEIPEPASVAALRKALTSDSFWAVRAAAATALGRTRRDDALSALCEARHQENPRVRLAVATALGEWRNQEPACALLEDWVKTGDPSCFVEAAAANALGCTRSPHAVAILSLALGRDSYREVIRTRAIEGLGATGDEAALPIVEAAYKTAPSFLVRRAAAAAAARLAEGTLHVRRIREQAELWLKDNDFRVRIEAASALASFGDLRDLPVLERALAAELDGRTRRHFKQMAQALREKGKPEEKLRGLQEVVKRLSTESVRLCERIEKLEARDRAPGDAPVPPDTAGGVKPSARRPRPGRRRHAAKTSGPRPGPHRR